MTGKPKRTRKWVTRFRSAITGRYVDREQAEDAPRETVAERYLRGCVCGATRDGSNRHSPDCPADRNDQ